MVSVILPTLNEMKSGFLQDICTRLSGVKDIEVVVVDGGSTDGTLEFCRECGFKTQVLENSNRAERINAGSRAAKGDMLILNHPRSVLDTEGIRYVQKHERTLHWGGFMHAFDSSHPVLQWTSWYSNRVRAEGKGIYYLDHCMYVRKSLLEQAGYVPEVDIFEDTELSLRLLKTGKPELLSYRSLTSSVRYRTRGFMVQALLNMLVKLIYYFNLPHSWINRLYEHGLFLNKKQANIDRN